MTGYDKNIHFEWWQECEDENIEKYMIKYCVDEKDIEHTLTESAMLHIEQMVLDGYTSGELFYEDYYGDDDYDNVCFRGQWSIK